MAPRVLIFGAGNIGATYAFILSRALPSENIVTVCRSNYDAALANGFTINSTLWGMNQQVRPTVVHSAWEAASLSKEPFDFILITSKALEPNTATTAKLIAPAVSSKTVIAIFQNGVGIEGSYARLFSNTPILSCVVYHKKMDMLHIGPYPASPDTSAAQSLSNLLKEAGATSQVHEDVQFERWSKLLLNASWNPICALTRSRDKQILESSPLATPFIVDVMREIASVAQKLGYEGINEDLIQFQLGRAKARELPGVEPSMLSDALGEKKMEVEAIVGNVVEIAERERVETPLLRAIYVLATALNGRMG